VSWCSTWLSLSLKKRNGVNWSNPSDMLIHKLIILLKKIQNNIILIYLKTNLKMILLTQFGTTKINMLNFHWSSFFLFISPLLIAMAWSNNAVNILEVSLDKTASSNSFLTQNVCNERYYWVAEWLENSFLFLFRAINMRELVRTGLGKFVEFCKNPFFLDEHFKHKRKNTGNTKGLINPYHFSFPCWN
jgi:hypothetical protein